MNAILFQGFQWYTPGGHWTRLSAALQTYADLGITSIWLPPGCKANQPDGNGYDCYDLWDLGEFDQKGARSTKWGSREELRDLMDKAKSLGIAIVWDAVLSHKTAGDSTEECWAVEVDPEGDFFYFFIFSYPLTFPSRPPRRNHQTQEDRTLDPLLIPRAR